MDCKLRISLSVVSNAQFTTVPLKPQFDKNVGDNLFFLTQKVFISVTFSIVSYKKDMQKSLLQITHE